MATKRELRELYGDGITEADLAREIAQKLNPAIGGSVGARAWQWKHDLWIKEYDTDGLPYWKEGVKNKFHLFEELGKAPRELAYFPGPKQTQAHAANVRVKQVAGGWRAGKSTWLAAEILPYMFRENAHIWLAAKDYTLGRYEFEYIYNWLNWLGAPVVTHSTPANGPWTLELAWGAKLETQTADDATKIEGAALDCAGVSEAGLMPEKSVRKLRGRVAQKHGPILMAGSLDGSEPWYMNRFEEYLKGPTEDVSWHSFSIPSWDNAFVYPGGRVDEEILEMENTMPDDEFKLKVAAEVAKPSELVFPEFDRSTHVFDFKYEDTDSQGGSLDYPEAEVEEYGLNIIKGWTLPKSKHNDVHLAIDPGYNNYSVLALRVFDDKVFVIDEVYMHRMMAEDVIRECKSRWWWPRITLAVMDIAGKQNDAMGSNIDIWADRQHLGMRPHTTYVPIPDGIQKLRTWLRNPANHRPRVFVDKRCEGLISEFRNYRYRLPKSDRDIKDEPVDSFNHSIKALEYYLVDRFNIMGRENRVVSESYIKNANTDAFVYGTSHWEDWWR